ncbi:MAG TPA: tRNA pseudouridine(55) synthase TruB [Acidimicrobiales bacterium]|nr:tRNA pseudouridine(55) synthase TruB [Acidimicrobiales bacterium]
MVDGLVVVDKEPAWTSHDAVARCRRIFGQKRVGHAGTLDPDATGVLLVGLGRATRLLRFLTPLPKTYVAEVVLGVATSTLDASGEVVGTWDMSGVMIDDVRNAATALTGSILQVPPMVSAVKVGGKRLHELARAGVEVEREPRPVTVHRFEVAATDEAAVVAIEVECSSGTYVRTLAADLGQAMGGGAHLRNLRRTAIGSFDQSMARTLSELEAQSDTAVLPPAEALRGYASVVVEGELIDAVAHGKVLSRATFGGGVGGEGPWAVLDHAGSLLAVYEAHRGGDLKPAVVMAG